MTLEASLQASMFRTRRRAAIAAHETAIGLDFITVERSPAARLLVHFVPSATRAEKKSAPRLRAEDMRILREDRSPQDDWAIASATLQEDQLVVDLLPARADSLGLRGTFVLMIDPGAASVARIDPFFQSAEFSFEERLPEAPLPSVPRREETADTPEIDYLARDYAAFRQLMIDRVSHTAPGWRDQHPGSLGQALIELVAYAADHLSYYQDAVATEAYLGTARRRVSIRRHSRLLDYTVHEGCNARTWVRFVVDGSAEDLLIPAGTKLVSAIPGAGAVIDRFAFEEALRGGHHVFETMQEVDLSAARNEIELYSWGARTLVLAKGATRATLAGKVDLRPGEILILAEVAAAENDEPVAVDPHHRCAIQLTRVSRVSDPLGGEGGAVLTDIEWRPQDALPFDLQIAGSGLTAHAFGNVVLADHGNTTVVELEAVGDPSRFRPILREADLTHSQPLETGAAGGPLAQDPRRAVPLLRLSDQEGREWKPRQTLLGSGAFDRTFVVETENDGTASLRFGNGIQGALPRPGAVFQATYRTGSGSAGNVGPDSISHVAVQGESDLANLIRVVTNPLPAQGGTDPESVEQVRLHAPQAFRKQERCVIPADFAAALEQHPEVEKAAATMRWTGSWYTTFVIIDRRGGKAVDEPFRRELLRFLASLRLAGSDIAVQSPRYVALDISLKAHLSPKAAAAGVERSLLQELGTEELAGGRRGFFHPRNFTLGQPVYWSQLVSRVLEIPGVETVEQIHFDRRRHRRISGKELKSRIAIGPLEVARLAGISDRRFLGGLKIAIAGGH